MKKAFITVMTLLLCLSLLSACGEGGGGNTAATEPSGDGSTKAVTTEAPAETPADQFEFEAGDKGLIVTGYHGSDKKVLIPSVVDNKKVVEINTEVFAGNIVIEEVILSEYMTVLDLADFAGCDNLTAITYPGDVTSGRSGEGPANLTTLRLPGTKDIDLNDVIADLCERNPNLKNLDLSGIKSFESKLSSQNAAALEGISLTLSETAIESILQRQLHLYETIEEWFEIAFGSCEAEFCPESDPDYWEYLLDNGAFCFHHLEDDNGQRYDAIYLVSRNYSSGISACYYISEQKDLSYAEGLTSQGGCSIQGKEYEQYLDYAEQTPFSSKGYQDFLSESVTYLLGQNATVENYRSLIREDGNDLIDVATVLSGGLTYECVYGHEFIDNAGKLLLRRYLGDFSSDRNFSMTEYFGEISSITINGTTYTYDWQ